MDCIGETVPGVPTSPLGSLVAEARSESYSAEGSAGASLHTQGQHTPFHGYFFKIVNARGNALIAYPDKWGSSGVMTFIVNNQGRVYSKNLGPRTAAAAAAITEYDPDPSWRLVRENRSPLR